MQAAIPGALSHTWNSWFPFAGLVSRCAGAMAKTHKHLWQKVTSLGNLMQAANLAMSGRRSLAPAAGFFAEWELECVNLSEELENGSYLPGPSHGNAGRQSGLKRPDPQGW